MDVDYEDIDCEELVSCNNVGDEEGKEDMDIYKKINDLTDDDIRGLEFVSEEKAIDFYEIYAKCHGFAIRKDDVKRDYEGNIIVRQLVCNREGKSDKKRGRCRDPRPTMRMECRARFRVALNLATEKWRVSVFEPSHNHELTPTHYVHMIPKYRRLSESDKALVDGLHTQGVRTCHILGFMMAQKGGHKGLGFCKKDLYNYLNNEAMARIEGGDAFAALSYLQAKADNDPMFFSKFTTTDEGRLENLFWSDSTSRIDYECFGDVIAFDATYKKNKYNMPIVVFSGFNHHGETTIFGCALVSDEKAETYKWVLNTFLEAMYHKHPKGVVTDGDLAMREAIRDVFPNSLHRLCSWHLHRNAIENVKNPKFLEDFKSLIYATYTVDEFENEWKRVVDDCGLSNNKWVKKTYEMKRIWASAYMRDKFFCGIRTTSISEAVNSFIKMYVQNKSSLVDFMHGFERAVKEYRNNELISNFKTFYYDPVLTTKLEGLELEAAKIFTRNKFKEVQDEIEDAIKVNVIERSELENVVNFKMNMFCNKNYTYLVHLDRAQSKFLCDCNLFERVGIPCSHIICAMRHEHMNIFPNSLICKRWTKSAKDDYISSMSSEECDDEKMVMLRRGTMSSAFNSLCDISCKHPDDFKEAMKGIYGLCEKIKRRRDENGNHKTNTNVINDPIMTKTKGAPRKSKDNPRKTKGASRKTKGVPRNTSRTKHKYQDIGEHYALHEVDKGFVAISNVGGEGVDKNYGSQRKKKDVDVACSMKEFINKRTSKHIENEDIGRSNENMSNIPTTLENNVHGCGLIYGIPSVKIEGQNVTWNHSLGYAPNYTLGSNNIPVQSTPVPTQFPPTVNFSSSHLNALMYPRPHIFPHNTSFLGVLEQVESSAKMACKKNDPYK